MKEKDKGTAYLLLLISLIGLAGIHRFYLEKVGTGIIWLLTFGLLGVGTIYDLFTLGNQVDVYNAIHRNAYGYGGNNANTNNIVINMPSNPYTSAPPPPPYPASTPPPPPPPPPPSR
jgi:TM2 domain-containing membrane protein YozV